MKRFTSEELVLTVRPGFERELGKKTGTPCECTNCTNTTPTNDTKGGQEASSVCRKGASDDDLRVLERQLADVVGG